LWKSRPAAPMITIRLRRSPSDMARVTTLARPPACGAPKPVDTETTTPARPTALARRLNLPMMVLYGLGTTIGAGIYALIGEVAGAAGMRAPLAFFIASVLAAFTALAFAELCSRYPKSAGEAVYVSEAFDRRWLATLVGLLVVTAGSISASRRRPSPTPSSATSAS
jgi:amino acid permease